VTPTTDGQGSPFYQALLEHGTDLIAGVDRSGAFLYASPSFHRVLGYRPDDLLGSDARMLVHQDDRAAVRARFSAARRSIKPCTSTFRLRHAAGSWRVIESTARNGLNDPRIRAMIINGHDITDRPAGPPETTIGLARDRAALAALLDMAGALLQLDDGADTGGGVITGTDAVGRRLVTLTRRVLGCNRVSITALDAETGQSRSVAAVGLTPEEERRWRTRAPGTALSGYFDQSQTQRLYSEGSYIFEASSLPGQTLPYGVQTMLCVTLKVGSRIVGVLALDHGTVPHSYTPEELALARAVATLAGLVLERERLLRERADAHANELALRDANRRMDAFLMLASHELKTPLTSAGGNIEVAQRRLSRAAREGTQPADLAPLLARARRGFERMERLVDDLLDTSRIQADKLDIRLERCDMCAVVRDAVDEQHQLNADRRINIEIPQEAVWVIGDPERISQVVINYLTNAIKYAPPDRPIEVGVGSEGTNARVWVRDEGRGLTPDEQARVWERFHRIQGVEQHSGSRVGLGLGLFICRTIVERLGGQVGVDSIPDKGATFWFTVPITAGAPDTVS
jgi:PAS domain S-box-containing protein